MRKIISKSLEGVLLDPNYMISFQYCSDFHYNKNLAKLYYIHNNIQTSCSMNNENFKIIENLYDDYQVNKIALELIKTDPISSVSDIYNRAKEFYFLKKEKLNQGI